MTWRNLSCPALPCPVLPRPALARLDSTRLDLISRCRCFLVSLFRLYTCVAWTHTNHGTATISHSYTSSEKAGQASSASDAAESNFAASTRTSFRPSIRSSVASVGSEPTAPGEMPPSWNHRWTALVTVPTYEQWPTI